MKIRSYKPEDRRLLLELNNRFLHRDRLPEKPFMEHLPMSPNFQAEGCFFLLDGEERPDGAGTGMLHRKAFNEKTRFYAQNQFQVFRVRDTLEKSLN